MLGWHLWIRCAARVYRADLESAPCGVPRPRGVHAKVPSCSNDRSLDRICRPARKALFAFPLTMRAPAAM